MKIKPLATNQRVLMLFCVYPRDVVISKTQRIAFSIGLVGIFAANFTVVLMSTGFILKFLTIDFVKSLNSTFQLTGSTSAAYACALMYLSADKLNAVIEHLQAIYREFEHDDSYEHLVRVNNKSEKIWQLYFKFVMLGFFICTNTLVVISLVHCYIVNGAFDINLAFKPYEVSLPWDQNKLFGYLGAIVIYNTVWQVLFVANGALLLLFISICWHHQAFYLIFEALMKKLNESEENRNNHTLLCNVIRFHNLAKGWFEETSDVFSRYILVQMIINIVTMAISVFLLDMQIHHTDSHLQIVLYEAMMGVFNLFLYCYYGKMTTESFEKVFFYLFEHNWYEMPVQFQKYFILMMGNAQRPCFYHGFDMIILNLETFTKVVKTVYAWYMMFKFLISRKM